MIDNILNTFYRLYGNPQIIVKSPGRANIIGEHTDYNHGLVLPFSIDRSITFAIAQNPHHRLRVTALDIGESCDLDIDDLAFLSHGWSRYFINTLMAMGYSGKEGFDVVCGGDLPSGGGVSSSSALTCGFLSGVAHLLSADHDHDRLIHIASQAENGIGLNGGIMDQSAIIKGLEGQAMLIDFASDTTHYVPMPPERYSFYLINSGQKHNLVDTEYNQRRSSCEEAVRLMSLQDPRVSTMRDITPDHITSHLAHHHQLAKRCRHVITENTRVKSTIIALQEERMEEVGHLLNQSHASLSQDYEVSTSEIDILTVESRKISNLLGCRIMGGGFGGCTINLVDGELSEEDISLLHQAYKKKTGLELEVLQIQSADGVRVKEHLIS